MEFVSDFDIRISDLTFVVFEQKKVQLETLGEYLLESRKHLKLSLGEVSARIGVKANFLHALETGNFKALPAEVYVFGFLRQLAEFYNTDGNSLIGQYKKEQAIQTQLRQKSIGRQHWLSGYLARLRITPKLISIVAGALFLAFTIIYVVWQVSSINKVPALEIFQPKDRQVVFGSSVDVKGKTDPGMGLTVNGQEVFVDSSGAFQTQLSLETGPKDLIIVAKNKFDKTASAKISIVGQPQFLVNAKTVELRLEFSGDGNLEYIIDDSSPLNLSFRAGDAKTLSGQNKILISTSNAGATVVFLNGQRLGPLGRMGESLSNIPFFAKPVAQ